MGACLLAGGCERSPDTGPSSFVPEVTEYVSPDSVSLHTRISGVAWDPEAFFMNVRNCGPTCPMPPFLSEGIPLYQRSAVRGGSISAFDPVTQRAAGAAVATDAVGLWVLPEVPSRADAPFFIRTAAQGALPTEPIGPPLPAVPPTQYLPTHTLRPIPTINSVCVSQEAVHIGRNGVLEAVAKYLTLQGRPTQVSDLLSNRYHSVAVIGLFHAGNGANRAPADETSVEVSGAQVFHIDWAPPGSSPDELRSARGFIVTEEPTTPVGFAVVLVPSTQPRPTTIEYKIKDTKTDRVARRPWMYPPISAPPIPGVVTFIGVQMRYQPPSIPVFSLPPPPSSCIPM